MKEFHSSDLTAPCLRMVQLRHEGKAISEATGALWRGLVFGEACRWVHEHDDWESHGVAVDHAVEQITRQLEEENRPLSESVAKNTDQHCWDIQEFVRLYCERFQEYFTHCHLVGCEVPIRWTIGVDGEDVEFASHLDLLFAGPHPANIKGSEFLWVWDWKLRDKSPSPHYIGRNMQLGMYGLAVNHGEVMVDDVWLCMERQPRVGWLHANYLKPYAKKVNAVDDMLETREFQRGDQRPLNAVLRELDISDEGAILDEFFLRVRMARAGHWPTNPDPEGCRFCEVSHACPSWDWHGQPEL